MGTDKPWSIYQSAPRGGPSECQLALTGAICSTENFFFIDKISSSCPLDFCRFF